MKKPWLPNPPKKRIKCKLCAGQGSIVHYDYLRYQTHTETCTKCGGKGYL